MTGHVFLVGMPGSGKSSVGRVLADRLGTAFLDLDQEVERVAGRSVDRVFAEEGEDGFRERESAALRAVAEGPPAVVACGGGVVLREANRDLMRATGSVVYLEAALDTLTGRLRPYGDRPLARSDADVAALLERRRGIYARAATVTVDAGGPPEQVAAAIVEALG